MLYAAYGSNLHPVRLMDRISSATLVDTACMPNWSLSFNKRSKDSSGKCSIRAGDNGVHLAIFEISSKDKLTLDKIEGRGIGYAEISLSVPEIGSCISYGAQESYIDDSLRPYDWYKELVMAGARFHGFPHNYLKEIELVQTLRDLNLERNEKQWKLVDHLNASS